MNLLRTVLFTGLLVTTLSHTSMHAAATAAQSKKETVEVYNLADLTNKGVVEKLRALVESLEERNAKREEYASVFDNLLRWLKKRPKKTAFVCHKKDFYCLEGFFYDLFEIKYPDTTTKKAAKEFDAGKKYLTLLEDKRFSPEEGVFSLDMDGDAEENDELTGEVLDLLAASPAGNHSAFPYYSRSLSGCSGRSSVPVAPTTPNPAYFASHRPGRRRAHTDPARPSIYAESPETRWFQI